MGDLLTTWIALLSCSVGVTSNVTRWESVGDLTEDNCYKLRQETGVTCWQQASGTWAPLWTPFNDELAEVWLTAVLLLRSWSHWFVSKSIRFVSMKTKQNVFSQTSVFVLFTPVQTNLFSYEMRLSFLTFSLTDESPCLNKDLHYIFWCVSGYRPH